MRASPPCDVALRHFGVWRAAIVLIGLGVLATLVAWALRVPHSPVSGWIAAAAATAGLATLAVCASLWRPASGVLRWDGLGWTFVPGIAGAEPESGRVEVSVDLGSFMLLRFIREAPPERRAVRWLPTQRRGLEREWHSFRCAVYSPRPVAGSAGVDAPAP